MNRYEDYAQQQAVFQQRIFSSQADRALDSSAELIEPKQRIHSLFKANYLVTASRSLAISYPTIEALLGDQVFNQLAHSYALQTPNRQGDWGLWGEDFPSFLTDQKISEAYAYLPDCARLDWAVHMSDRAINYQPEVESWLLLESDQLKNLKLVSAPSLALIESQFPLVEIFSAHQKDRVNPDLNLASSMLAADQGQIALVCRNGWATLVTALASSELHWYQTVLQGCNLADAIDQASDEVLAFEQWLPNAIGEFHAAGVTTI